LLTIPEGGVEDVDSIGHVSSRCCGTRGFQPRSALYATHYAFAAQIWQIYNQRDQNKLQS
jgi:hypothetical protein